MNLFDGNRRDLLQHFSKLTVMIRGKVKDYDIGYPRIAGNMPEEFLQRLYAAGRSPKTYDKKPVFVVPRWLLFLIIDCIFFSHRAVLYVRVFHLYFSSGAF